MLTFDLCLSSFLFTKSFISISFRVSSVGLFWLRFELVLGVSYFNQHAAFTRFWQAFLNPIFLLLSLKIPKSPFLLALTTKP